MLRLSAAVAAVAVFAITLVMFAGSDSTHAEGAIVLTPGFACAVLDGAGNPVVTEAGLVNVDTNGAGTATITCSASGVTNDTGRAQRFDHANTGYSCYVIDVGWTEDWHAVVSSGGRSSLVCHITR